MALNFLMKRTAIASKRPEPSSMALGELDVNYDADTGGLFYKNSTGGVVKVGPPQLGTMAPNSTPAGSAGNSVGEFWFDTSVPQLKIWNGSAWDNTVNAASTSQSGTVQLNDSTSSTSTTTAATPNAVKSAYDLANAALPKAGGTMTGAITFDAGQTFFVSGIQDATTGQKGVVQVGTNIQASSGTISVNSSSTTQPGVVQLNDTVSSTSATEALTANQGYLLQQQIDALSVSSNLVLAGTIDASTGDLITVTTEGSTAGFAVNDPLPSAVSGNDNYFVIVTIPGTMTPPGGVSQLCHQGDWWLSDGTAWQFLDVGFNATTATTSTPGIVQLATDAEVQAGLNTDHAVVPSALQSKVSDSTSTSSSTTIASSTAVKSAYDLANAAIPNSVFNSKGDIIIGTGNDTYGNFPTGTNGQVLTADSACTQGVKWNTITQCTGTVTSVTAGAGLTGGTITGTGTLCLNTACVIQPTIFTAKGSIISASAVSTPAALAVGTNGQMLVADSVCTTGLKWASPTADIPCSTLTAKGTLISASAASTPTALPVGTNGQMLVADSACTTGLKWAAPTADVPCSALTAKGAIITATAASTPTALLVGTDGQVLTACSACSTGLVWATAGGGGGSLAYGSWYSGGSTICYGDGASNAFNANYCFQDFACNVGFNPGTCASAIFFCCSGVYKINFSGGAGGAIGGALYAYLYRNTTIVGSTAVTFPSGFQFATANISCMLRMNAGDCIRITSYSTYGAAGCWNGFNSAGYAMSLNVNRIGA